VSPRTGLDGGEEKIRDPTRTRNSDLSAVVHVGKVKFSPLQALEALRVVRG
jgi:hypothetical protein